MKRKICWFHRIKLFCSLLWRRVDERTPERISFATAWAIAKADKRNVEPEAIDYRYDCEICEGSGIVKTVPPHAFEYDACSICQGSGKEGTL